MDLLEYHRDLGYETLDRYTAECSFVFHLAGVNRPIDSEEFADNYIFTRELLKLLKMHGNKGAVLLASSVQAERDNPYGKSKKIAENELLDYGAETGNEVYIYRLPGVFGKGCRPNYNNVIATFCDAVIKGLPLRIDDPGTEISICYIDDVTGEFIDAMEHKKNGHGDFYRVENVYKVKIGELAELISSFKNDKENFMGSDLSNPLISKLYSTYRSYV